jgi:Fe-S cluster assembly iron-binding protein IscA
MSDKIKIKISTVAYDKLTDMLNFDDEYNCYRIKYLGKCCSGINVELIQDNIEEKSINNSLEKIDFVDALPIIYDKSMLNIIESVTIVYRKSSFQIKITEIENNVKNHCTSCKTGCSDCNK